MFDDNTVKPFDTSLIQDEAFGGEEKMEMSSMGMTDSMKKKEKIKNAYMLFYERKTYFTPEGQKINQMMDLSNIKKHSFDF